jgi:hypothetical protein
VGFFGCDIDLVGSRRFFSFDFIHRKATVCPGQGFLTSNLDCIEQFFRIRGRGTLKWLNVVNVL